ncbi:MAG: hypothetical protein FJ224_03105 [Lentisphaerae bacterium]|nr:hypothetical protein [Lentisphaerota bacterium]
MAGTGDLTLQGADVRRDSGVVNGEADGGRRRKPPANHPWRQYRSVYLQKKRIEFVREREGVGELA